MLFAFLPFHQMIFSHSFLLRNARLSPPLPPSTTFNFVPPILFYLFKGALGASGKKKEREFLHL